MKYLKVILYIDRDDLGDLFLELLHEGTSKVGGCLATRVRIGSLQITSDIFSGIVFKHLHLKVYRMQRSFSG